MNFFETGFAPRARALIHVESSIISPSVRDISALFSRAVSVFFEVAREMMTRCWRRLTRRRVVLLLFFFLRVGHALYGGSLGGSIVLYLVLIFSLLNKKIVYLSRSLRGRRLIPLLVNYFNVFFDFKAIYREKLLHLLFQIDYNVPNRYAKNIVVSKVSD